MDEKKLQSRKEAEKRVLQDYRRLKKFLKKSNSIFQAKSMNTQFHIDCGGGQEDATIVLTAQELFAGAKQEVKNERCLY